MSYRRKRILQHAGFWLVYFCITFFNELYLTSDFNIDNGSEALFRTFFSEVNRLVLKMAMVYYYLYSFIPRWLRSGSKARLMIEGVCALFAGLVIYRGVIQYVNWQLIFQRIPDDLSFTSIIARYLYSLLDLVQIIGIAVAIKLFRLRIKTIEHEKKLIHEKKSSELLHLRSQINPHFLFNMLNNIYSLARVNAPSTPEVVHQLSVLLRFMLYETEKEQIPLSDEIKIIDDLISLQRTRFEDRVYITRDIVLSDPHVTITPLLLLPLVENAFKHGVGSKRDQAFIHLKIRQENGNLYARVENSIFRESIKVEHYEGIGLSNIKRQLQLLYTEYDLLPEANDNVFTVTLKINLNSYAGIKVPDS